MALDPDIQKHFDYKYVEGELHMFVSKDLVQSLGWTEKELDMSFGGLDTHYVPPHTCDHERTVMSGNVQLRSLNTEVDTEDPWH